MAEAEDVIVGSLDVKSTPEGAKIYINDEYQKVDTQCIINNIPEGNYTVKLELEGYETKEEQIYIEYNEITYVDMSLVIIPEDTGSINITTDPIGASIYLDSNDIETETPTVLSDISLGIHLITLTKDGYNDFITTVEVKANEVSYVDIELDLLYVKAEFPYVSAAALLIGLGVGKLLANKK